MKLKPEQIKKLTCVIYNQLIRENLLTLKASDKDILKAIESVLLDDAKKEDDIETKTKVMMKKFETQVQSGEIDYQKMYGMIKKQIIKESKFIV